MDQETVINVTKKEKNPKNVEKGKKLAEWNKKNKEEIRRLKEINDVAYVGEHGVSSFDMNYVYAVGISAFLVCGYYCWKRLNESKGKVTTIADDDKPKIKPTTIIPKVVSTMD